MLEINVRHFNYNVFYVLGVLLLASLQLAQPSSKFKSEQQARQEVILQTEIYFRGEGAVLPISNCTNVPQKFVGEVSSIDTNDECVQIYDDFDCSGQSIKLPAVAPFHKDLTYWHFNDRMKSVSFCHDPCIPAYGKKVENSTSLLPLKLTFYSLPDFKGLEYKVKVNGCTSIYKPLTIGQDIQSVRLDQGRCVLVYAGKSYYDKRVGAFDCVVDEDTTVYELREGIPLLNNFLNWDYDSQESVKAIGPCQCELAWLSEENDTKTQRNETPFSNVKVLTLYSNTSYQGSYVQIPLNFTGCKNLSSLHDVIQWEGLAKSFTLSLESCIKIYRIQDCQDSVSSEIKRSISDLSEINFDNAIRSISSCYNSVLYTTNENNKSTTTSSLYYWVVIGFPILCIFLSILAILIFVRMYRQCMHLDMMEMLSEKEIDEFVNGLGLDLGTEDEIEDPDAERDVDTTNEYSRVSSDLLAQNLPYNDKLEIPRSQLKFDCKGVLGTGEFGVVLKGIYLELNTGPVAIKTTKASANAHCLRSMLKEVKVMMYVGRHPHIVELIGCCTSNIRQGELLVVLEYCENGSLEMYLKTNRAQYKNYVIKGKLDKNIYDSDINDRYRNNLMNLNESAIDSEKETFDLRHLIKWCVQISQGMYYLANKRVIHGDLSARNVLLTNNLKVKISDFGLSRKMYCYSQYTRNAQEPLPWRWLALECLKNLEFSTSSDVWSFGILMWEIFTLGEQPYPGVASLTNNFIVNLDKGLRPTMPPFSTSDCYNIMSSCWDENTAMRPSFAKLIQSLSEIMEISKTKIQRDSS